MSTVEQMAWRMVIDHMNPKPNPYKNDPVAWVQDRLHEHLWSTQQQIANALIEHRRVAVPSCHGPGKSYTAGRLAGHFIDAHPPGDAFVVTSAPTDPQVKAILWREIQHAHRKGQLPGRVTQDAQWKIGDELVAFGRKPADAAADTEDETITAFQGIHARFVLVIFDEACGIPKQLWTAGNSLLTNDDARFLAIGNPDDPSSEFAQICAGADLQHGGLSNRGWYVIPISLFDTPNFTGEPIPDELRPYLPGETWLTEFVADHGSPACGHCGVPIRTGAEWDEHERVQPKHQITAPPLYVSKVLGRFPRDRTNGMIPWSWMAACRGIDATRRIGDLRIPRELGVDVGASDNGDLTVVRERKGQRAGGRWQVQSADSEAVARVIVDVAKANQITRIKVDAIGAGWGLVGLLRAGLPGVEVVPVLVSEAAPDGPNGERYVNLRAALWWEVGRELSKSRGWDLTEVDDRTLTELAEPRWFEDKTGRIQVEAKDRVRKRLGRSPDDADALLLAFYSPANDQAVSESRWVDQRLKGRNRR